jgi:hypothetical protein
MYDKNIKASDVPPPIVYPWPSVYGCLCKSIVNVLSTGEDAFDATKTLAPAILQYQ